MFFKQILVEGMGCLSYLIGCPKAKTACVVDPQREVTGYLDLARQNGMKITRIFETHIHADHISGNMELQAMTGADIFLMAGTPVTYEHQTVEEGETLTIGSVKLKFIKTPGHTPDAMSILVTDKSRMDQPWLVLTGDCMFVGDVGRPDLAGRELLDEQVNNLYQSLFNKLLKMPSGLEVFPAHGDGSMCGRGMSSKTSSTIGFEQMANPLFSLSKEDFIQKMSSVFPSRPKSFSHIIAMNKKGPNLLKDCIVPQVMSPMQFKEKIANGALVLDTRDTAAFGGVNIPGSLNIGLAKQTANWISMVIEPEAELALIVDSDEAFQAMCSHLHRIGYDNIIGYLYGGMKAWQEEGYEITQLWQISIDKLRDKLNSKRHGHFFDVRSEAERENGYIEGSESFPLPKMLKQAPDLPKDEEIIVTCQVGYRGNIAASYLQKLGFQHVHSLAGGYKAWNNAGYPSVS
jgi:glyoxylase-like metal-dependent hydrolase (beta-lactamase superfamily II)/rhodanese-related sulfurtransferase